MVIDNINPPKTPDRKSIDKPRGMMTPLETSMWLDISNPIVCSMNAIDPIIYPEFMDYLQHVNRGIKARIDGAALC